jgi:hypothetical protein
LATIEPQDGIGGVGGIVDSVVVKTRLQLTRADGMIATFRGEYAACVEHEALDISVLGRDILEIFAVIVDRPSGVVAMLGGRHRYTIEEY